MAGINIKTTKQVIPQCYAYTLPNVPTHDGWTKIGFTERDVEERIKEQTHTVGVMHKTWWKRRAVYLSEPYDTFTDREFHSYLKKLGIARRDGTEWFQIHPEDAKKDFINFADNHGFVSAGADDAVIPYILRAEQEQAVQKTLAYFTTHKNGEFLWNAKPRFGKTLTAYDLCFKLGAKNILIVTNRPAIANSWYADYETFFGQQSGYLFVSNVSGVQGKKFVLSREDYLNKITDETKGCIEFVSLQDLKGSIYFGGQHDKLSELSKEKGIKWDILIIDEAHEGVDTYKTDTAFNHIDRKWTLHLSGTPFKALANEKFPDNAIFNWTYADEQEQKNNWDTSSELESPYENLPCLNLYTYQMSEIVRDKVRQGIELADNNIEEYAFDLNEFFSTDDNGKFVYESDVDKFLDALTKQDKFPFSSDELRNELKHTFWLLNRVASAKALAKKLNIHPVFKDYKIVLAAGDGRMDDEAAIENSFKKVKDAIRDYDKTITLSVGQLTTGVTIPEWTAVLMLSNMSSPALYMQAAFRAQNPCLFTDGTGEAYRKTTAYVFDFDPARTLTIFEQFANDLIPKTRTGRNDIDQRKENVRKLINFFPVYGEDEDGSMVQLDAEKVLTIPRRIHAREVVERGFMSNFLFSNIANIFGAPRAVLDLINNMQALEEPRGLRNVDIDDNTANDLHLNDDGEVELPKEHVVGLANDAFGPKVYENIAEKLGEAIEEAKENQPSAAQTEKEKIKELQKTFSDPIATTLIETAKEQYGSDLKQSTQNELERKIRAATDHIVQTEYGDYKIRNNQQVKEHKEKLSEAQDAGASMEEITRLEDEFAKKCEQERKNMVDKIQDKLRDSETVKKAAETIVEVVETEKLNNQKAEIEGNVRDHLRGFSRTIPAFLMAYGDKDTTLENFDTLVPAEVFLEVTTNPQNGKGVSIDDFRFLRDGGDYIDETTGETKHFDGHLFDEVVFNDAVQEFLKKREELANYFETDSKGDIFDYIPPQRTNQIFTPKKVVKDMVDRLEGENPGCFDDPNHTFADLYMKSGMYIAEIVTRLYQSNHMKELYPDEAERLNHIFAHQVFGCAPTEIIFRICLRYLTGFSAKIAIAKHNIILCDTLELAKTGKMEETLKEKFNL